MSATVRVAAAEGESAPSDLRAVVVADPGTAAVARARRRDPIARERLATLGTRERLSVGAR